MYFIIGVSLMLLSWIAFFSISKCRNALKKELKNSSDVPSVLYALLFSLISGLFVIGWVVAFPVFIFTVIIIILRN